MGLFSSVVMAPLAPVRGVIWIAEQVAAHAESQRAAGAPAELEEIAEALAAGQISADQAAALEEELLGELISSPVAVGESA